MSTTVTYRTVYMPASAPARTKTFESTGRLDSLALAELWIRTYAVEVVAIDTEDES